jgi:hypothetical protein
MSLHVGTAESTDLFIGDEATPRQVLRVNVFVEAPRTELTVSATVEGEETQPWTAPRHRSGHW